MDVRSRGIHNGKRRRCRNAHPRRGARWTKRYRTADTIRSTCHKNVGKNGTGQRCRRCLARSEYRYRRIQRCANDDYARTNASLKFRRIASVWSSGRSCHPEYHAASAAGPVCGDHSANLRQSICDARHNPRAGFITPDVRRRGHVSSGSYPAVRRSHVA